MKKIAPAVVAVFLVISWSTTLSAGEDLERLDLEASYCLGVNLKERALWKQKWANAPPEPAGYKDPVDKDYKKAIRKIVLYFNARGQGHQNATAQAKGIMDASTCESESMEQLNRCDQRCNDVSCGKECSTPPVCAKTRACHNLSERLPM